ncbi:MAG: DUF4082 domain-containing protein, partial [Propionicimonas sp.]|nr:DUF4082 domain-containing protein [Propionicimonas sp.]
MPAVWYPVASQVSAGTSETGGTYKEVTIADAQAGDLLVAVGLGENSGPNANSAISTTSGSTGTWTVAKAPTVTNGDTVAAGGYTTVSTTGAVVVKIKVATNSNADYSGGGVLRIPAAEVGASYGWLNAGFNADADGQISGVLSTGSLLLYAAADWNANAAAASTAGTPSTNVTYHQRVYSNGHYSLWIASWTAQAAGTRNYGPSGLSGGDWSGLLFRMDSGPVVIPVDPATLSLTGQAVAGPAPVTLGVWGHHDDGPYFGEDYTDAAAAGTGTPCGAVILSAGEAGHTWASGYSVGRENGLKAAWATLLGVANSWTDTTITLAGKTVATSTLAGTQCRLIFLRIPDGGFVNPLYSIGSVNGYLMKLWTGALSSVTTHDSANSYTKQQLLDVLAAAITLYGASVVRHQNHLEPFGSDHTDHTTAGKFAAAACYSLSPSPTQYAYLGYVTSTMAANVFGADLAAKEAAFGAYWPYDSEMNSGNWRAAWIDRCYKYPDPASGTPTATTRRILTSTDDTALGTNTDAGNTVVGMGFTVTAGPDLLLTEITLRIPAAQNALVESLPVTAHLWTGTGNYPTTYLGGARIAALTRGATNVATLERPVRLIAGQRYWVTAHFPQGYYPRTANVFTSGAKTSGDGRLLAYQASTAPNSTYDQTQIRNSAYLGSGVVPTNATFGDPWYGLDVTVADIAAGTQTIDADPATSALAGVQPAAAGTGTAPLAADTAAAVLAGIQALLTGTGPAGATADVAAAVLAGAQPDLAGSGQSAAVVDPALLQLGGVQATPSGSGPAAATVDPALLAVAGTGQAAGGAGATPVSVDPAPLTVSGQDVAGGGTILL